MCLLASLQVKFTRVESASATNEGTDSNDRPLAKHESVLGVLSAKLSEGLYPSGPIIFAFFFSGSAWQAFVMLFQDEPLLVNCVLTGSLTWAVLVAAHALARQFGWFATSPAPPDRLLPQYLFGRFAAEFFFVFTATSFYGENNVMTRLFSTSGSWPHALFSAGFSKFVGFMLAEGLFILPCEISRPTVDDLSAPTEEEREPLREPLHSA